MISAARRENSRSLRTLARVLRLSPARTTRERVLRPSSANSKMRRNHIRSPTKSTVEIYMRGIYIDFAICHYIFHTTPIVRNGEKKNVWICKLRPLNYLLQAASPLLSDKSLALATSEV